VRMTVVGMLSGTSFDAIDAAVADIDLDGDEVVIVPRGLHTTAFPETLHQRIAACLPPRSTTVEEVCRIDTELGQLFGGAALEAQRSLAAEGVDLVVSHGQTVFHWVEGTHSLGTLQLGAPAWIAEATGAPVVSDLRSRDVARGGHGAPLASTLDALLVLRGSTRRGSLNLGGIANITVRGAAGEVIAYDIGPANALMDGVVAAATSGAMRMDTDGAMAARGEVDDAILHRLLDEPYYGLPAPKSTGKELFHGDYLRGVPGASSLATDDLLATLTELTARLVARACRDHDLAELVVAGGGVRNPVLMTRIAALAVPTAVVTIDAYGLAAQAKEAYLFALLGYLAVHGIEGTYASATGASKGSILGSITPGARPLVLPSPATTPPISLRVVRP